MATLLVYQLDQVEKDISTEWGKMRYKGGLKELPKLSKVIGGDRHHDWDSIFEVVKLKTGLTLYNSVLKVLIILGILLEDHID